MKTATMNLQEVMAQLEAWGSPNARKLFARQGAGDNQFGVTLGKLRGLAKKLKIDHQLAMKLWATGNVDAMILATMLMTSAQLSAKQAESMIKPLTYSRLVDELVRNVLVKTAFADQFRSKWVDSGKEMIGRAGWKMLGLRIVHGEKEGLDFGVILKKIEAEILCAPYRKQEAMNCCLVDIGVNIPEFTRKCIDLGERLGKFDKRPVPKGCVSTYAPEWIGAALKRKK